MSEDATMDMKDYVSIKPTNDKYDTLQVDIKALPFRVDGQHTRLWLNGDEIHNVESIDIDAGAGRITKVTITFLANVSGVIES